MTKSPGIAATAIDLFCGAGRLTRGLLDARVEVAAGYDIDDMCRFPYEYNNLGVRYHRESITALTARDLARHYSRGRFRRCIEGFPGGPDCQLLIAV